MCNIKCVYLRTIVFFGMNSNRYTTFRELQSFLSTDRAAHLRPKGQYCYEDYSLTLDERSMWTNNIMNAI